MADLFRGREEVQTYFDLLGRNEDDMTYSLGWVLSRSDVFLKLFLRDVFKAKPGEQAVVRLQEHEAGGGRTDIEVETTQVRLVVEAKRGWDLPSKAQLSKYAKRVKKWGSGGILVLSECTSDYAFAAGQLPQEIGGVPVFFRRWHDVLKLVDHAESKSRLYERRRLADLACYLRSLLTVQDPNSNMVRVVALNDRALDWADITLQDVVLKKHRYFNPIGKRGFPREPPNYFGFRFDGRLQQVRHVERYKRITRPHEDIPEIHEDVDWSDRPHYLYTLGPPIVPTHDVLSTKHLGYGRHVEAAIDLLLTCKTIPEAVKKTSARLNAASM